MTTLHPLLRAAITAAPRTGADLARTVMAMSGPDAVLAKIVEAALADAPWAECVDGLWRIRAVPPPAPVDGVMLAAVSGERTALATWVGGKLGDVEVLARPVTSADFKGLPVVAFSALPGALDLRSLCRALDPARPYTTAARAAADWKLSHRAGDDAAGAMNTLAAVWDRIQERASEQGVTGMEALRDLAEKPRPRLDLAPYRFNADFLANLPEMPGVYRFLDADDAVFYVGKARRLRNRILSYFRVPRVPDPKWTTIVERLKDIEFAICGSELDALLDEYRLIAEFRASLINIQVDAHARAARTLPDRSVWVLPAEADDRVALWAHRRGEALVRVEAAREPRGVKETVRRVQATISGSRPTDAAELAIAESWLSLWSDRIARLDPDRPDLSAALEALLARPDFGAVTLR